MCANTKESESAVSILPIGVESIEGEFEKDDIVLIFGNDGKQIGVGRTQYNSDEAENHWKKGKSQLYTTTIYTCSERT